MGIDEFEATLIMVFQLFFLINLAALIIVKFRG